jgi:hypothetical protein
MYKSLTWVRFVILVALVGFALMQADFRELLKLVYG